MIPFSRFNATDCTYLITDVAQLIPVYARKMKKQMEDEEANLRNASRLEVAERQKPIPVAIQ